ncbi:MAG: apolipoprotein N-acyltransferase [Planctomycetota bacterium]
MNRMLAGVFGAVDPRGRAFLGAVVFALAHAIAFGAAYPPFGAWGLSFVAMLPLLVVATRTEKPLRSALGIFLGVAPMWWWHHSWILDVTGLGFPLLVMCLSLYPAAFVWTLARLRARWASMPVWAIAPLLWAGLEVIRGEVLFTGYPWFLLAHPLIEIPHVALSSGVVGVYTLSAAAALPSAVVCAYLVGGWKASRVGAVVVLFVVLLPSVAPTPAESSRSETIVVVQTAVPQDNRTAWLPEQRLEDFGRAMTLTVDAAQRWPGASLIVWPETMFPGFTLEPDALAIVRSRFPTPFADAVQEVSADLVNGIPMLIGAIAVDGYAITPMPGQRQPDESWDDRYNSAFLVENGAITARYDKRRLAPFGEILPYVHRWPWLQNQVLALGAQGMSFDLSMGDAPTVLEPGGSGLLIGTPICFETAAWDVCRDLVFADGRRRSEVLVTMTNDGWFGDHPGGRAHHLLIARWRAAELRTPVVRAANTGISAAIDRSGRVIAGTFADETGAIVGSLGATDAWGALRVQVVPGVDGPGLWIGGWINVGLGLLAVVGVIASIVPRRETTRPDGDDASYDNG